MVAFAGSLAAANETPRAAQQDLLPHVLAVHAARGKRGKNGQSEPPRAKQLLIWKFGFT